MRPPVGICPLNSELLLPSSLSTGHTISYLYDDFALQYKKSYRNVYENINERSLETPTAERSTDRHRRSVCVGGTQRTDRQCQSVKPTDRQRVCGTPECGIPECGGAVR